MKAGQITYRNGVATGACRAAWCAANCRREQRRSEQERPAGSAVGRPSVAFAAEMVCVDGAIARTARCGVQQIGPFAGCGVVRRAAVRHYIDGGASIKFGTTGGHRRGH